MNNHKKVVFFLHDSCYLSRKFDEVLLLKTAKKGGHDSWQ